MGDSKKLTYNDLPPHVDMLCDAMENKGASPSGISHPVETKEIADEYRLLLKKIRAHDTTYEELLHHSQHLFQRASNCSLNNQHLRITKIAEALNIFLIKEYNKHLTR